MNISFQLTTRQVRARMKRVTRRLGWLRLVKMAQTGTPVLQGVVKGMGLKKGEKIEPLCKIRVVSARREPLRRMTDDPEYGRAECVLEGFGDDPVLSDPAKFVEFFCRSHKGCTPETKITRIEFNYVDENKTGATL